MIDVDIVRGEVGSTAAPADDLFDRTGSLAELKAEAERRLVLRALERNGWHVTRTAEELQLSDHASLSRIMRRHGLSKPGS
jgi:transcriptional regulator with GAF, ATPase, and Fis domain